MTGVILFRAQPFHNGHLAQIKRAYKDMQKIGGDLYVLVGSADKSGTKRNPIPIDVRLDLIKGSLKEEYAIEDLKHMHIGALQDLSDEANNTHSWGNYLYNSLCMVTDERDFIFYYSDKPEIALSWFSDSQREHFWFRFLPRIANEVSATDVRKLLYTCTLGDAMELEKLVPNYVYGKITTLHDYIVNAR